MAAALDLAAGAFAAALAGFARGLLAVAGLALTAAFEREIERAQHVAIRAGDAERYLAESSALFGTLIRVVDQLAPVLRTASATLDSRRHHAA